LLVHHPSFAAHSAGPDHSERPLRYSDTLSALRERFPDHGLPDPSVRWCQAVPEVTDEQIARVHTAAYSRQLRQALDEAAGSATALGPAHLVRFDADTAAGPGSREAVLRAAGAVCKAVQVVMDPEQSERNAFCLVRPPGHHAESARAMGFCFINNVMVGAAEALALTEAAAAAAGGGGGGGGGGATDCQRVAIFDFDVHHGNGTAEQASLRSDGRVLYLSTHQHPFYPGTGDATTAYEFDNDSTTEGAGSAGGSRARGPSSSRVVNVPLLRGSGSQEFRHAVAEHILPAIRDFSPDLLMLSAGFDAHEADPLAQLRLTDEDFQWVTTECALLAAELCEGRLVSVMEGGYDTAVLARNVTGHVELLQQHAAALR
jgi:acetoin utilization deacetylase AcuC-like enzyme